MGEALPITSITISPDRQRRELRNIEALAESIGRIGLIHPPVVTRENVLVAGERRLTAVRSLGWTHIPVTYTDELDPSVLHIIELEENTRRADLPWQDECRAVETYHNLRRTTEPKWSAAKTAEALGRSPQSVSEILSVANELSAANDLIVRAQNFSVAKGLVARISERKAQAEAAGLRTAVRPKAAAVPQAEGPTDASPLQPEPTPHRGSIEHWDFHKWAPTYTGDPFNFLHCDFPYGINADKRQQGTSTHKHGGYADSPDVYWALLERLAANLDRICTPHAHIMFWFSMDYYAETLRFFNNKTDFVIQPFPIYWWKTDNVGLLPDPTRGPRRVVETALIGSRGDRKIVQAVANCHGGPTIRDDHMSIKPPAMLRHFYRMFVDEHTAVLDPTCGSGSSIRAALDAGAYRALGLEANIDFARSAAHRLENPDAS